MYSIKLSEQPRRWRTFFVNLARFRLTEANGEAHYECPDQRRLIMGGRLILNAGGTLLWTGAQIDESGL